jgi:hypothetical protein
MKTVEYDSNLYTVEFGCNKCGVTANDPDTIIHAAHCPVAREAAERKEINKLSEALGKVLRQFDVDFTGIPGWRGTLAMAGALHEELNKE